MPCMTLGGSLTGVSDAQPSTGFTHGVLGSPMTVLQRLYVLAFLVQAQRGIKMPHRNLLVMERT